MIAARHWVLVCLAVPYYALRLLEMGVKVIGKTFEWLGRQIERALGVPLGVVRLAPRAAMRKAGAMAKGGALIVADPFLQIAQSFVPQYETVTVSGLAASPEPAKPGDEQYRAAVGKFGLSPVCPRSTAEKKWATLRAADPAREQEIDAAWSVICAYRGFRMD